MSYYQCQRCNACCKWPGDVKLTNEEVDNIAAFLGMDSDSFIAKYCRLNMRRNGLSLIEKPSHECIFLIDGGCHIQSVKPQQCKDFPNKWNFPGWQNICKAKLVEGEEPQ